MRRWSQSRRLWLVLLIVLLPVGGLVLIQQSTVNPLHPALDKLAAVSLSERWSHPEMVKIRQMGKDAVPSLRRVLREKDRPSTQFLLWLKSKWPRVTRFYPYIPDRQKLTERRWAACQVLQILGPAGKSAVPELIKVIASKDPGDVNGGSMALWAVGIDAEACEQLDEILEKGTSQFGRSQIVMALANVKPPSERTLKSLTRALTDTSPYVPNYAADALGQLGVASPAVIGGLKTLISTSTNDLTTITASVALWELEKDSRSVTGCVVQVLEKQLLMPLAPPIGGGSGGQGVDATEQMFMKSAALFSEMELGEKEKVKMLGLLESFCEKSGRIFIRMLLLPSMMKLGFPREKCIDVCNTGLQQEEEYYRLQAAQLLALVAEKYPVDEINLNELIHDKDVGIRVYTAKIHWRKNRRADVVVPVLTEALDRNKHQSYYYAEILPAALNTLGEIGIKARAAESTVSILTQDPNPNIAKLASETLRKIGGK
jgi:HEAT repeat protein